MHLTKHNYIKKSGTVKDNTNFDRIVNAEYKK